jgi:hypothetical protein
MMKRKKVRTTGSKTYTTKTAAEMIPTNAEQIEMKKREMLAATITKKT